MRKNTADCTMGGLLHDVGKIVYRAGLDAGNHSESGARWLENTLSQRPEFRPLFECARYHHARYLKDAPVDRASLAWIVYIADNIAAGADRRERCDEGTGGAPFEREIPLSSVFNILNGGSGRGRHAPADLSLQANYPSPNTSAIGGDEYRKKAAELEKELKKFLTADGKYINSLLGLLETLFSFIPSSTATNELCDISLYDHCKVTAAVAAAISEYLAARGADDFKEALFAKEKSFMDEKAFLLFSCDFSGIQKFIYMVEPDKALKSLRSRSFTLELFMEHIIDEIIEGCGLSRANLIYSGGGHAYILLPNTEEAKSFLRAAKTAVNRWLSKNFGTALFLASAWCECSPNDLRNIPAAAAPYPRLFRELSAMLSAAKNARYSADELRTLNFAKQEGGRECRICGTEKDVNSGGLCLWCSSFAEISNEILKEDIFISVTKEREAGLFSIELPEVTGGERRFAAIADLDKARRLAGSGASLRTYSKNRPHSGINYSTNLYMGDYVSEKEMSSLAAEAEGIERIAICRADVDNLGLAFTAGFQREGAGAEERFRYQTLSRSAAFSRGMSLFFKYHINSILSRDDRGITPLNISSAPAKEGRKLLVVYSGGDDVFIVGAWDDVIGAACDIQKAFEKYTQGTLSLSAGIGIFKPKYPIYHAAALTEELEAASKSVAGKGCVTLFEPQRHTYKWERFRGGVLPKVRLLEEYFSHSEDGESAKGKAFLYRLLELARNAEEKINIARAAYLLARMEPSSAEKKKEFAPFSADVFSYFLNENERQELITAIYIYVYMVRQRSEE